jgi:hypothetical protein
MVQGMAGTNQPNPTIRTAKIWVPTMAQKMGAEGQGGLKMVSRERMTNMMSRVIATRNRT